MKRICVIGSLNVDVVTSAERFPRVGESVFAKTFEIFTGGGKGANQAFALGRLGADVLLVGKTGDTFYGPEYVEVLRKNGVDCTGVAVEKGVFPGVGLVAVDANGDNLIFVYPGANALVDVDFIEAQWERVSECEIFLFQLEIPLETNGHAMRRLQDLGKLIIFDPAPAVPFPEELYGYADIITPNETELQTLSGIAPLTGEDFAAAGRALLAKGAGTVIAKAGKHGAYLITKEECTHIPGFKITAVDPTAAGDAFNAGLAYALSQDCSLYESIKFGNAVGALTATAMGAQSAMPTLAEVERFLGISE